MKKQIVFKIANWIHAYPPQFPCTFDARNDDDRVHRCTKHLIDCFECIEHQARTTRALRQHKGNQLTINAMGRLWKHDASCRILLPCLAIGLILIQYEAWPLQCGRNKFQYIDVVNAKFPFRLYCINLPYFSATLNYNGNTRLKISYFCEFLFVINGNATISNCMMITFDESSFKRIHKELFSLKIWIVLVHLMTIRVLFPAVRQDEYAD